jgi:multiple sugar transport system permease protein
MNITLGRRRIIRKNIGRLCFYAVCLAITIVMVGPFAWGVLTSLKPDNQIIALPLRLLPTHFTWEHYVTAFQTVPFGRYFLNSFTYASLGTLFNLFLGSISGYAFAKLKFKGRNVMFRMVFTALTIPSVVLLIPQFLVLKHIPLLGGNDLWGNGGNGLLNTLWGVVLPGAAGPTAVFLMRQFFMSLPDDLMEGARIDGSGEFRIYWQIYLPLTKPALATLAIFSFPAGWNNLLWPLIVLNDSSKATVQMALSTFTYNHHTDFGPMLAAAVVAVLPIIVLFVFLQKYYVEGVAFAGIKG